VYYGKKQKVNIDLRTDLDKIKEERERLGAKYKVIRLKEKGVSYVTKLNHNLSIIEKVEQTALLSKSSIEPTTNTVIYTLKTPKTSVRDIYDNLVYDRMRNP
jgi:hypothetical protein